MTGEQLRILIYSRNSAGDYARWLEERHCPGTIRIASTPEAAAGEIEEAEVLFCWRFPPDLVRRARTLRWIQSMGAGIEDLLVAPDLDPSVRITRVTDVFGSWIGEYVFAELLARTRKLDELRSLQARRRWEHLEVDTLAGKTIGVAGLGSIGREIVRKARAFDMHVCGLSRTGRHAASVDRHFGTNDWPDFVRELDVLVLTLPLTPESEGVVDQRVFAAMQPHAVLVNVGRGRLVVEDDLIRALEGGQIGGAILDVFSREPLPTESPLWSLPRVTVTPHISGPSTVPQVGEFFLENLRRYLRGERLLGLVDRTAGY